MELADYNITFVHIKGKIKCFDGHYLQVKNIRYLQRTIGEPKNTQQLITHKEHVTEISATDMHTLSTTLLHTEQS